MLCDSCQRYPVLTQAGRCSHCWNGTSSVSYELCDPCSIKLAQCQMCRGWIDVSRALPSLPVKPGVFFVRKGEKDNNGSCSLKPGEQIHITLPEERWGKQWSIYDYPLNLDVSDRGAFTPDPNDFQNGERTIIFTARSAGTGKIELHQSNSSSIWTITVKVK